MADVLSMGTDTSGTLRRGRLNAEFVVHWPDERSHTGAQMGQQFLPSVQQVPSTCCESEWHFHGKCMGGEEVRTVNEMTMRMGR